MTDYPIIKQRSLPKASRRGPLGLVPPRRDASELPLPNPHEAVVYKSAGRYVVDDGRSRTGDDHIVNATNITVVDMREDAPVMVQATIPSAGAAEFVVRVTFLCTVKKPDEVVEAGLKDITASLTHYLIRHQPLFHLGEDYHLGQVTAVRRNVTSEVKAYFSVRPAHFSGLDVKLGNIQVMTPDELRSKQSERELEGLLTSGKQQMEYDLARQKAAFEEARRRSEEQFQQQLQQQKLAHDQLMRTASFERAAVDAARLKGVLGAEVSEMATILPGALGERSISETADSLNARRERRQELEADDALLKGQWAREDARYERQLAQENTRMKYDLEVERLKAQAEVFVEGLRQGLGDSQGLESVMSQLRSMERQAASAVASARAHEAGQEKDQERPKDSRRPQRSARPERADAQADDRIIEAEIVAGESDEPGDDSRPEPREEDLGR